jgi:hypothetical protein
MPLFSPGVWEEVLNFTAELGEKSVGYRRNITNGDYLSTDRFSKQRMVGIDNHFKLKGQRSSGLLLMLTSKKPYAHSSLVVSRSPNS